MTFRTLRFLALVVGLSAAYSAAVSAGEPLPFGHSGGARNLPARPVVLQAAEEAPESDSEGADASELEDIEERLKVMEAAWSDFQEDLKEDKKEAASKPTFKLNGRIHADYWAYPYVTEGIGFFEHPDMLDPKFGQDPEDLLAFRRVRLEASGDILENMLWRIQIDFNNPSLPEMKDVYVGFDELPANQVLFVGNQKRPLSIDSLNSSRDNVFMERPGVIDAFDEDYRRPGICMWGHTDDEVIGWAYGTFLLANFTLDGRYRSDVYQASANGRLWTSPWYDESSGGRGYSHFAVAGMVAHPDGNPTAFGTNFNEARFRTRPEARTLSRWLNTERIDGAQWYEVFGLESMVNVGPWQVVGEAQANWLQRHHANAGPDLFFYGAYMYVSYFLTGEHIPYERDSGTIGRVRPFENFFLVDRCTGGTGHGWGAWNVALRYDYLSLTDGDITGGTESAGTLAVNWFFNAYAKLQFNLIYGKIDERGPIGGFDSGRYLIAGTRLAVEF